MICLRAEPHTVGHVLWYSGAHGSLCFLSLKKAEKAVFQCCLIAGLTAGIDLLYGQFFRIGFQPAPRIKTVAAAEQKTGCL